LGQIGKTTSDRTHIPMIVNKLTWIADHAEDWALRYAAVVSLQEIGTVEAIAVIKQALLQESDVVVQGRMAAALAVQSGNPQTLC
jgi:bilin biosynthesis PecF protein